MASAACTNSLAFLLAHSSGRSNGRFTSLLSPLTPPAIFVNNQCSQSGRQLPNASTKNKLPTRKNTIAALKISSPVKLWWLNNSTRPKLKIRRKTPKFAACTNSDTYRGCCSRMPATARIIYKKCQPARTHRRRCGIDKQRGEDHWQQVADSGRDINQAKCGPKESGIRHKIRHLQTGRQHNPSPLTLRQCAQKLLDFGKPAGENP